MGLFRISRHAIWRNRDEEEMAFEQFGNQQECECEDWACERKACTDDKSGDLENVRFAQVVGEKVSCALQLA